HASCSRKGTVTSAESPRCSGGAVKRDDGADRRVPRVTSGFLLRTAAAGRSVKRTLLDAVALSQPARRRTGGRRNSPCAAPPEFFPAAAGRSLDLGARRLDHRRELLLVGGAEGGGVLGVHPEQRGALLGVGSLHPLALQRLLAQR